LKVRRYEKAYTCAGVPISRFVSNPLPLPNLTSSSSRFSNVISNEGFNVLKMVIKVNLLQPKSSLLRTKLKLKNSWNSMAPKMSRKKTTNFMGMWQTTMVCGKHHDQAVVAAAQLHFLFPKCSVLGLTLDRDCWLGSAVLCQLGLVC